MRSLSELRQVCERATKGPWQNNAIRVEPINAPRYELNDGWIIADFVGPEAETNAAFTATFNPAFILSLLDQLAAAQPTWTTEKPTRVGWYWWRVCDYDKLPIIYRIEMRGGELKAVHGSAPCYALPETGEWAGPIPTPGWRMSEGR